MWSTPGKNDKEKKKFSVIAVRNDKGDITSESVVIKKEN